ncbi:zinc finger MYM-type protein 1-like [Olea europaea var. sylvestris]|uniref:zinc finger MYM-type protein 1-like n=1 Tax=Olea europaea var. sylvestris TaxID=158386 RepID=UPI000C1D6374|nr:zinc finger MYM-type protein 1-like [Olea europaea var. sylvestris]
MANRVRQGIRTEFGDAKFSILVDEARDESSREQMAIIQRFVNSNGILTEPFFAIKSVIDTTSLNLKNQISDILVRFNFQVQNMRGQGYDGANNMRGSWNGLQAVLLKDCPYAYYVNCFAHRLQFTLVSAAKDVSRINELKRSTRWSSHYSCVKSLIDMYAATCKVLEYLSDHSTSTRSRSEVGGVFKIITTFEFVFILHLMRRILAIADVLCQSLQKKTQDILTTMRFVCTTKTILQALREDGWEEFLEEVKCFCSKNDIHVLDFDGSYMVGRFRGRDRGRDYPTIEHHYHFDIFNATIDFQMMELDTRFNETSI